MPKHAVAVVPSDANELDHSPAILYCGVGGNIAVVTAGGESVTFVGVVAGTWLPCQVRQVMDTSTTATNMVYCW